MKIFASFPIQITLTNGKLPIKDHSDNSTFQVIQQKCKFKCRRADCESVTFLPMEMVAGSHKIASFAGFQSNFTKHTQFQFFISDRPIIMISTSPQIALVDFITFILGCPCFWFGVAPLPFLLSLPKYFNRKKVISETTAIQECEERVKLLDYRIDCILNDLLSRK